MSGLCCPRCRYERPGCSCDDPFFHKHAQELQAAKLLYAELGFKEGWKKGREHTIETDWTFDGEDSVPNRYIQFVLQERQKTEVLEQFINTLKENT